jgi:carboxysome shell carbonic anhydrase
MLNAKYREKSLFWRPIPPPAHLVKQREDEASTDFNNTSSAVNTTGHTLVNTALNVKLRDYEMRIKAGFDEIEKVVQQLIVQQKRSDFEAWAQKTISQKLGITLSQKQVEESISHTFDSNFLYGQCVFAQFMDMSKEFFELDPLHGQNKLEAERKFREAGFHAVGIALCADGRLAHFISYVLRIPYSVTRRKAHAGALFDVSESVRNWVFIEHSRFRDGIPNSIEEPTRYLKIAVYHYSKSDPHHQGCAAHGSDDTKAAEAALTRLKDFIQAIENRFGCGSTVQTLLIGMNTDDDSLKVHVPNQQGKVCLKRFVETDTLYHQTNNMNAEQARDSIQQAVDNCNQQIGSTAPAESMNKLIAWFIENNFSQIEYVKIYENGCYSDIGHAERFIGIGNGFEEVQLRNLTYYSYLDTVEEGVNDVNVGIKIFTGLNIKKGWPIPIIIRCDYDGRVPGSRDRAEEKANRIEQALHDRYSELSNKGQLQTLCTLRDNTGNKTAERLPGLVSQ